MDDDTEGLRRRLDAARAEIERLRLTLDVVATVDLDAAILNRNGLLESLDRARRWQARRGDVYGLLVVLLAEPLPGDVALVRHVAATIASALREVDEVARVDGSAFAAVLGDIEPGSVEVVCRRVNDVLGTVVRSEPRFPGPSRLGGIEILNTGPTSDEVLDAGLSLAADAPPGGYLLGSL